MNNVIEMKSELKANGIKTSIVLMNDKECPINLSNSDLGILFKNTLMRVARYQGNRERLTIENAQEVTFSDHNGLKIATFYNPSHDGDNTCDVVMNDYNGHKIGEVVG